MVFDKELVSKDVACVQRALRVGDVMLDDVKYELSSILDFVQEALSVHDALFYGHNNKLYVIKGGMQ